MMKKTVQSVLKLTVASAALLMFMPAAHAAADAEAAKALARQNKCLNCHAVEKDKDGPSYKSVAAKFKGKANAEARLIEHITSGEKAKFPDGHEEEHKIVKTTPPKDMAQIKNLIQWILEQ
jgi:cytochrome c